MKQLFLLLMLVMSFESHAQTQTAIEGIGKLRLEMSLNEVKRAFPKMLTPLKPASKFKKVYKINSYTPIKNHTLKNIHLYFYNDTLYAFYVKNAPYPLLESLTIKYGKPRERLTEYNHHLLEIASIYENDAADFLLEATRRTKTDMKDIFYSWNEGNPFIQCVLVESLYYNDKFEQDIERIFYMRNRATAKIIELEEELEKVENKEKRLKELDGL